MNRVLGCLLLTGAAAMLPQAVLAQDCDRDCLEQWVDRYMDAVINNAPESIPLSEDVRFTENGQELRVGDGLWHTMEEKGEYRIFVSDVPAQQVAFLGNIAEENRDPSLVTPAMLSLRLRIANGEITEIEQFVVRDEAVAERFAEMSPDPLYTADIPESERMSRERLLVQANKYFTGMQQNDGKGDYPFTDDCNRLENGIQTTNSPTPTGETRPDPASSVNYSIQWSCLEQFESGLLFFVNRIRDRRYVAVDSERGLVFAFGFFDHSGGEHRNGVTPDGREVAAGPAQPWTWQIAEIFRIEEGQIRRIDAILERAPYGMNSGWSSWEQGMSDELQDVTFSDD